MDDMDDLDKVVEQKCAYCGDWFRDGHFEDSVFYCHKHYEELFGTRSSGEDSKPVPSRGRDTDPSDRNHHPVDSGPHFWEILLEHVNSFGMKFLRIVSVFFQLIVQIVSYVINQFRLRRKLLGSLIALAVIGGAIYHTAPSFFSKHPGRTSVFQEFTKKTPQSAESPLKDSRAKTGDVLTYKISWDFDSQLDQQEGGHFVFALILVMGVPMIVLISILRFCYGVHLPAIVLPFLFAGLILFNVIAAYLSAVVSLFLAAIITSWVCIAVCRWEFSGQGAKTLFSYCISLYSLVILAINIYFLSLAAKTGKFLLPI
jgi:hypothetical protein